MYRSRVKWVQNGWCSGPQYMSGSRCGWEKKCCEVAGVVRVVELSPRMGKTHGMFTSFILTMFAMAKPWITYTYWGNGHQSRTMFRNCNHLHHLASGNIYSLLWKNRRSTVEPTIHLDPWPMARNARTPSHALHAPGGWCGTPTTRNASCRRSSPRPLAATRRRRVNSTSENLR